MQLRKPLLALLAALLVAGPTFACTLGDIVTKGSTSRSVSLDIIDSTDGTPETGVVFNTSGIALWYRREGAVVTDITEVTLAALTTAYTSGGVLAERDGSYRVDVPDAAFATGANYVDIGGTVTGMIVICQRVRLVDYSLEDSVRMGLTGLANATPGASGGLLISGSNSGTTTFGALTVTGATTHTGNVVMSAGLNITQSSSNTPALVVTGNGTGNGATITSGSGATGNGLSIVAASTNGNGLVATGTGTGAGSVNTAGATGVGVQYTGGSTSGNAIATTVAAPLGPVKGFGILESGTLQSATGTTAVLRSATSFPDNTLIGSTLLITGGTGVGQRCTPTAWTNTTDTATCPTWTTTPDNTSTYEVWGTAAGSGGAPTVAQIATGVWQDSTAGDFTTASSIGKALYTGNVAPGGTGGLLISGSNSGTTTLGALTVTGATTLTGAVSGTNASNDIRINGVAAGGSGGPLISGTNSGTTTLGALTVTGATTHTGATTYTGAVTASNASNDFRVNGAVPGATGGVQIAGTNAATTYSSLTVSGATTFTGAVTGTNASNDLRVNGATPGATGGLQIAGTNAATTYSSLTVSGATTLTGAVTGTNASNDLRVNAITVGDKTGYTLSTAGINAFADASTTGHTTGGTWGGAWNAAGAGGDPWSTALPGGYAAGTAGNILGNRLDVAVSSRLAPTVAARTLDVSATGEAGLDWANIGSPTTTVNLSGTTTSAVTAVQSAIAALNNISVNQIRDLVVDDMGSVTLGCALAVIQAYTAGDVSTSGGVGTYKDPSGAETRISFTITSNGNRAATITCPTYP